MRTECGEAVSRGKALLLAAQEHKPEANRQEIPRITDGGAGRGDAVQLRLRQKITLWRKQRLSVHILTPPEASLVVGLNQLISPLFLTDVSHLDHLFPAGYTLPFGTSLPGRCRRTRLVLSRRDAD